MLSWKLKIVIALASLLAVGLLVAAFYVYQLSNEPVTDPQTSEAETKDSGGSTISLRSATSTMNDAKRKASRLGISTGGVSAPRVPPTNRAVGTALRSVRNMTTSSSKKASTQKPAPTSTQAAPGEAAVDASSAPAPAQTEAPPAEAPAAAEKAKEPDAPPAPTYRVIQPMALVPLSAMDQDRVPVPPPDMPQRAPTVEELAAPPTQEPPADPALNQDRVMFSLQSGIFASIESAKMQQDKIEAKGGMAEIYKLSDPNEQDWYSIGLGNYRSFALADAAARGIRLRQGLKIRVMVLRVSELAAKQQPMSGAAKKP